MAASRASSHSSSRLNREISEELSQGLADGYWWAMVEMEYPIQDEPLYWYFTSGQWEKTIGDEEPSSTSSSDTTIFSEGSDFIHRSSSEHWNKRRQQSDRASQRRHQHFTPANGYSSERNHFYRSLPQKSPVDHVNWRERKTQGESISKPWQATPPTPKCRPEPMSAASYERETVHLPASTREQLHSPSKDVKPKSFKTLNGNAPARERMSSATKEAVKSSSPLDGPACSTTLPYVVSPVSQTPTEPSPSGKAGERRQLNIPNYLTNHLLRAAADLSKPKRSAKQKDLLKTPVEQQDKNATLTGTSTAGETERERILATIPEENSESETDVRREPVSVSLSLEAPSPDLMRRPVSPPTADGDHPPTLKPQGASQTSLTHLSELEPTQDQNLKEPAPAKKQKPCWVRKVPLHPIALPKGRQTNFLLLTGPLPPLRKPIGGPDLHPELGEKHLSDATKEVVKPPSALDGAPILSLYTEKPAQSPFSALRAPMSSEPPMKPSPPANFNECTKLSFSKKLQERRETLHSFPQIELQNSSQTASPKESTFTSPLYHAVHHKVLEDSRLKIVPTKEQAEPPQSKPAAAAPVLFMKSQRKSECGSDKGPFQQNYSFDVQKKRRKKWREQKYMEQRKLGTHKYGKLRKSATDSPLDNEKHPFLQNQTQHWTTDPQPLYKNGAVGTRFLSIIALVEWSRSVRQTGLQPESLQPTDCKQSQKLPRSRVCSTTSGTQMALYSQPEEP
ncbi:hypothetical protein DNTS_014990 [Danionella cerebrum]|uniref:Uncharacterized protein n=1 Tax=Danionella cerebrum TaxID=2873325 RepID=A0A553P0M5_9TELE|nr:hypothetical protein DNTS_014990 [Danionella translucida]